DEEASVKTGARRLRDYPDIHEEASVKTGARRLRDFPDIHSASSAKAERHERVCGRSHSTPRRRIAPRRTSGCDLSPALDLDLDSLLPAGPMCAGPGRGGNQQRCIKPTINLYEQFYSRNRERLTGYAARSARQHQGTTVGNRSALSPLR